MLKLTGEWNYVKFSGGYELFKSNEVSMNFYHTTKTLTVQGPRDAFYKEKLVTLVDEYEPDDAPPVQGSSNYEEILDNSDHDEFSTYNGLTITEDDIHFTQRCTPENNYPFITRDEFKIAIEELKSQLEALKHPASTDVINENKYLKEKSASMTEEILQLKREKNHLIQSFDIIWSSKNNPRKEEDG